VAAITIIFLRISLLKFVQFKAYQDNRDHGVLFVNLFNARLSAVFTTVNMNSLLNTNTVTK